MTPYEPGADARDRYPHWVIRYGRLFGPPEMLCWERRVILLDVAATYTARRVGLAHALAHLDLQHSWTTNGVIEDREEREAEALAARRLISLPALIDTLRWSLSPQEAAEVLEVDMAMLTVRGSRLTAPERETLQGEGFRYAHTA